MALLAMEVGGYVVTPRPPIGLHLISGWAKTVRPPSRFTEPQGKGLMSWLGPLAIISHHSCQTFPYLAMVTAHRPVFILPVVSYAPGAGPYSIQCI